LEVIAWEGAISVKAQEKMEEARFFLELLCRLENECQPLTKRPVQDEATYLASALMNACYSVLEHLRNGIPMEVERVYGKASKIRIKKELSRSVDKFKKKHPEIGKQRDISVHRNPVPVERHTSGGGWGSSRFGESAFGSGVKVELRFSDPPQEPVVATFRMDIRQLEEFIRDACEDYLPPK
jgi:hypothetical protein